MKKNPAFYTVKEFAEKLGVHPETVRRGIRKCHIQAFKVGVGARSSYRIPQSEIGRMSMFNLENVITNMTKGN